MERKNCTYVPCVSPVLGFGDVMVALAVAAEEEDFDEAGVGGCEVSKMGFEAGPLELGGC